MPDARGAERSFDHVVAVVGSPVRPARFDAGHLTALAGAGFTTVQLNTAWLARPFDEPLNLRDVVTVDAESEDPAVTRRRAELRRRAIASKAAGFRTLFHVGSPFMWRDPATGDVIDPGDRNQAYLGFDTAAELPFDVDDPRVADHEVALVRRLRSECPEIDDLLIYTFDQDAWQASEFGASPFSRGLPLYVRLPRYLTRLHEAWTAERPGSTLWWEPWELSAGQIYASLERLPRSSFGLCLHSNIAEVQVVNPADVWLRNTARMASRLGIPVVVEAFLGMNTEEIEPLALPCPRLVDEQIRAIAAVDGVCGIKEYFGIEADRPDVNLDVFRARLADPTATTDAVIAVALAPFADRGNVGAAFAALDDAIQLIPWDASWFMRRLGVITGEHDWSAATVRGEVCVSPSWVSSRRSHFMVTEDREPHPFLLEDIQLRCACAVDALDRALAALDRVDLAGERPAQARLLSETTTSAGRLRTALRGYALHLRETLVARLLREDLLAGRAFDPLLATELRQLLRTDADNQPGDPTAHAMSVLAETDLPEFLNTVLRPETPITGVAERNVHAVTSRLSPTR